MRKIGINVFNTVTRLFSHFVTRSPLSDTAQNEMEDGEGNLQRKGSTVWHRQVPSTQQGDESTDREGDAGRREAGMIVACGGGRRHGDGEEVPSTAEHEREEVRETQASEGKDDGDGSEGGDARNSASYVRRIVRRFESIVGDEMSNDEQSTYKRIKDDTKQCTRLSSERKLKDAKQGPENEPVKMEATSEGSGQPDENTLIPQTASSEARENEDKTQKPKTEELTQSRPWSRDEKEKLRNIYKEEKEREEKDEKEGRDDKDEKEEDSEDESESSSEGEDVIILRSKPRGRTLSYYRSTSFYRASTIRPRTVIIGLG